MKSIKANIHHLYHSGIAIETSNHLLIFDYYLDDVPQGEAKSIENGLISEEFLLTKENVLVFVTHSHGDHFNPVIFRWQKINPNCTYILSDDVKAPHSLNNVYLMSSEEKLPLVNDLFIKTYGTTDKGVSFLVEIDGLTIYHAGDLNWWHWKSFSKEEQLREENDFKTEVNKIIEAIDIAFIPVDPRLEEFYHLAGEYFINTHKPNLLVPIHFADDYSITEKFSLQMKDSFVKTAVLSKKGEIIEYIKST